MKLCLLLIAAVAGIAMADDDCCAAEDRRELGFMWKRVWASSFTDRKVAIAGSVYEEVFSRFPDFKALFKDVHVDDPDSPEWRAHLVRFATTFDTIINLLEDPDVLSEQLKFLNAQFIAKGFKKSYFEAVSDAFEHVLPRVATCFNVDAFHRCFRRLITVISKDLP